jgi:hypothetical protein
VSLGVWLDLDCPPRLQSTSSFRCSTGGAKRTSAGHALVACCFRGGGERKAAETFGENVAVIETRIQVRISNLNSRDLFACRWLRAPATKQTEGLAIRLEEAG